MVRRASAGRSRAARRPPSAPATMPPSVASATAARIRPMLSGAPSLTTVEPALLTAPWPKGPKPKLGPLDADGVDCDGACNTEDDAERAAEQALQQRFARHLPDDKLLRPADGLQRAQLAGSLRNRGECQQGGDQDGRQQTDQLERGAELLGQVLRVHQRPRDALGEILGCRHGRAAEARADRAGDARNVVGGGGAHVDRVHAPDTVGELLQLGELDVDVRGLAAERRPGEPDDGELLAAERDLVAEPEALPAGVAELQERLALRAGREVAPARDLARGHRPECLLLLVDARDRQRVEVDRARALLLPGAGRAGEASATLILLLGHGARDVQRGQSQASCRRGDVLDARDALDLRGRKGELGVREEGVAREMAARLAKVAKPEARPAVLALQ